MLFRDRRHAGQLLAEKLQHYRGRDGVLVLALPRGGVPVAFEVAKAIGAPLDLFLVRKLGLPRQPELAMGAVATGGVEVLNADVVFRLGVPREVIDRVAEREQLVLERQQEQLRGRRPPPRIAGRTIILVDDGLATGSTMRASVQAIRSQGPKRIVVAVPVGAASTCEEFEAEVDEFVSVACPEDFYAVAMWYDDFGQVSDEQVISLLEQSRAHFKNPSESPTETKARSAAFPVQVNHDALHDFYSNSTNRPA
jgi:putative phosphoribosyl transferase